MAILGKKSKLVSFNEIAFLYKDDLDKQSSVLDQWMTEVLGLTSNFPSSNGSKCFSQNEIVPPEGAAPEKPEIHPSSEYLSSITFFHKDQQNLCNYCQMHKCSDYCLFHRKNRSDPSSAEPNKTKVNNQKRCCRCCHFDCGEEEHYGKGDTPGFKLLSKSRVVVDGHGLNKKKMFLCQRNTRHMIQTSLFLTQVWRGNADIKPLLYYSDPRIPDVSDILGVVDYIISYVIKACETLAIEKKMPETL